MILNPSSINIDTMLVEEFIINSKNQLLFDVRSPQEYSHAHIPSAINLPLFSDDERSVVGTVYKKNGKEMAIKLGLDYFGPNMKTMVEKVEQVIKNKFNKSAEFILKPVDYTIYLHCWRGGMRSSAVAWLLSLYGFNVILLNGGYKAYRNWVLNQFEKNYKLRILSGYTGSGKTKILCEKRDTGFKVIDLEKLASHKGSAFGHIDMPPQPSQEMFENTLAMELFDNNADTIWLEDESQRIGHVYIPTAFWHSMLAADIETINHSFEQRLKNIVLEYGSLDKNKIIEATLRISKRLGGLDTKKVIGHIEENNITEAFKILLLYYDRQYTKASDKKK